MESDPWKKRRRSRVKHRRAPRDAGGGPRSPRELRPTSSFSPVAPSSAAITLEKKKEPPAVWRGYLFGLAGVVLLILLGGGHNLFALSLALILPGLALLCRPPKYSPGPWMDRTALAFLGLLLLSFIPQFYWPDPDWRTAAEEVLRINLPSSLSAQPWVSFEAWLLALAGFGWFYAVSSWEINHQGRKRFYLVVSLLLGGLSLVVLWGNMSGLKYPSAEDSTVFSFFPNRNQTANFLAVGGVVAFGYFISGLRARRLLPLVGGMAAGFAFLALVWGISRAGVLLFFAGIFLCYLMQIFAGRVSKGIKLGFPLLLIAFSIFLVSNSKTTERIVDLATSREDWSSDYRLLMAKDTWRMIEAAPLTGHGLGTFGAVFPQYRDHSANHQRAVHPESDLLWLTAETGILGAALFLVFVIAYLRRCRGLSHGPGGGYRLTALAALIIFMLHSLVDVSGHRPGTVYFAILFAVLALPHAKEKRLTFSPRVWRFCGGALVIFGLLWGLSGLTGLPLHTTASVAGYKKEIKEDVATQDYERGLATVDKWIELRPLDWRAYFQRATLTLSQSGARRAAAADFRRARFLEPTLGVVALEEGFAWLPYDTGRTISAWREVFFREFENKDNVFRRMLNAAKRNTVLMDGLARLSELEPDYRVDFLCFQSGDYFMEELSRELETDPDLSDFTREQRNALIKNWIERGDRDSAEAFLGEHESTLRRSWWLWSLLRKEQANFEEAVQRIRSAITAPVLPKVDLTDVPIERLEREFSVVPGDVMKGTALILFYSEKGNFQKVREVTRTMIAAQNEVPLFVTYWYAESSFQLQDYIESWYSYESYLRRLWEKS